MKYRRNAQVLHLGFIKKGGGKKELLSIKNKWKFDYMLLVVEMSHMSEINIIDEKAKHIYESHKDKWEKLYFGKIIQVVIPAALLRLGQT